MSKDLTAKVPKNIRNNPRATAIISKLNSPTGKSNNHVQQNMGDLSAITNSITERIQNNENITQLFPDVELSIQILTSSILAPNDMLTTNINYQIPEMHIPSDINQHILETIKKYITGNYDIESKLSTIVREALFTKGSYVEAILPEAAIDQLINDDIAGSVSVESHIDKVIESTSTASSPVTYLGNSSDDDSLSTEDFGDFEIHEGKSHNTIEITESDLMISISDESKVMIANEAYGRNLSKKVVDLIYPDLSTESDAGLDALFRKTEYHDKEFADLKAFSDTDRESIGKPLVFKLPTDGVIPVHVIGDVTKHLGYFVILDEKGTPINSSTQMPSKEDEMNKLIANKDTKLNIINKAKTALHGITKKDPTLGNMEEVYSALVESKLKKRLSTGMFGDIADIEDNTDIYRVMFQRALTGMKTRVLFIPEQSIAYYAFDYRENGTGKSMLEKVSMLFSIRSILLFSRLMANIKNSVTTTEVSATLDNDDPDPEKTMEKIISETMKTRQTQLPIGVTKIDDMVDWTHKVGFKYNFKHDRLPDMEISTSDEGTSKIVPDTDLDEMIQEHIIMSFGLTPELVQSGYDPDFATTALQNNILLAKRVIQLQSTLTPQISDHIQKLLSNDTIIREKVTTIVENNIDKIIKLIKKNSTGEGIEELLTKKEDITKYVVNTYFSKIMVTLPKPEVTEADNMNEAFEKYTSALDDYLDLILSSDALPDEVMGDMSDKMDGIKTAMKTVLTKKWMSDNGYMPEISEFLTKDDDGKPVFDLLEEYNEYAQALSDAILPFLKKNKKIIEKTDEKIDKLDDEEEEEEIIEAGDDDTLEEEEPAGVDDTLEEEPADDDDLDLDEPKLD